MCLRTVVAVFALFATISGVVSTLSAAGDDAQAQDDARAQRIDSAATSQVHGYVYVRLQGEPTTTSSTSPVPDLTVTLEDIATGRRTPAVKTGLIGGYVVPGCSLGTYRVCWDGPGFISGKSNETVEVKDQRVSYAPPVYAAPKPGIIFGQVTLKDKSLAGFSDGYWKLDVRPAVSLLDGHGNVVSTTRVNLQGNYILPGVPSGPAKVRAICEAATIEANAPARPTRLDLVLPNSPPRIYELVAAVKGQTIRQVPPGTTVDCIVRATDADGDALNYLWAISSDPSPSDRVAPTRKTASTSMLMPDTPGLYSVYVLVSDGKGGYSRGTLNISCGGRDIIFAPSGRALKKKARLRTGSGNAAAAAAPALAASACMRVLVDPANLRLPFNLRVTIPPAAASGTPTVKTVLITEPLSLLSDLPLNTNIALDVLDFDGRVIAESSTTQNSGTAIAGTDPPPYPYTACRSEVTLAANLPGNTNLKNSLTFYIGLLGANVNTPETADAYYAAIDPSSEFGGGSVINTTVSPRNANNGQVTGSSDPDPAKNTTFLTFFKAGDIIRVAGQVRTIIEVVDDHTLRTFSNFNPQITSPNPYQRVGRKTTFQSWKAENGFRDDDANDDASAVYFNANDLSLGRSMHAKQTANSTAYFVSNFPTVDDARQGSDLIATVAMDYSPVASGGQPFTKFYVFDNKGNRVNNADLDFNGPKFLPTLCLNCHGGQPALPINNVFPANGNVNAFFLPFDLESFLYSNFFVNDNGVEKQQFTRAAQEAAFKALNSLLLDTNPTAAIGELVQGWYGGAGLPGATANSSFAPNGWITPVDKSLLYNNVVKTSCRSCHIAQGAPINWASYDNGTGGFKQNGNLPIYVYGTTAGQPASPLMPQAKPTYLNFWESTSPHNRPSTLRADITVVVSPTTGLITTRAGGTASFIVKLSFPPTANVTIPLVVSNVAEGALSTASLVFTPANYNVAQTVTITGRNDTTTTGDVAYAIVLGPATSTDVVYNGFKPDQVGVTNK
jgi:hypothetical protein